MSHQFVNLWREHKERNILSRHYSHEVRLSQTHNSGKICFFAVELKVFKKVQETLQSLNSTTVCFVGEINRKRFTYRNIFLKLFLYLICWLHTTKINLTEEAPNSTRICKTCVICFLLACNIRKQSATSVHINSPKTNAIKLPLGKHSVKAIAPVFQSITPVQTPWQNPIPHDPDKIRAQDPHWNQATQVKDKTLLFCQIIKLSKSNPLLTAMIMSRVLLVRRPKSVKTIDSTVRLLRAGTLSKDISIAFYLSSFLLLVSLLF